MNLHTLKPRPGTKHRVKRLGCGESSGHGKTSGKGHKGQKARSGGSIRLGFEGGQMPLVRKMPKRGFNNAQFKKNIGLVSGNLDGVKILGDGELSKKFTFKVSAVSASARKKIEDAGGTIELSVRP